MTRSQRPAYQLVSAFWAVVFSLLLACATASAQAPKKATSKGDLDKGSITLPLYRGGAVPFELTVVATPNDCKSHLALDIKWNRAEDRVKVRLWGGPQSLEPFPDVERTLGVDYTPNPFFPEPEDYQDGRYQLWIISGAGPSELFFYDPATLDLLGSSFDFETPPPAVLARFPTLYMFATPTFQPKPNGAVDMTWSFPYSGAHRGDRPEFSHHIVTFPPPNLCGANPDRLDLSTLRPYISDPLPRSEARPWSDYLRGGLLLDVTIEPPAYHVEPPLTSLVATYSGATVVGGGIPRGFSLDIDAAFMGVAPPIRPWPGAGSCENYYAGIHTTGLNVCGGAP